MPPIDPHATCPLPAEDTQSESSSSTPVVGALVGRYVVLDELGRGGGGQVHAAFDTELERKVALKLLRSEGSSGARREARALAKLAHPNVVAIYDVGEADGHAFIAMELMGGETFESFAAGSSPEDLLQSLCDVGEAVAAAHDADLIHGDIKPSNVLRGHDGRTKLSDFGVARATDAAAQGGLAGTRAFMAPELFEGHGPSTASDQYAFCLTAWVAFHGRTPWSDASQTVAELASESDGPLEGTGPLSASTDRDHEALTWEARGVSSRVSTALLRGLHPDPAKRWPSMRALVEALRPQVGRRGRAMWGMAAAFAVSAGVWGFAGADDPAAPCAHARDPVEALWTDERREQVRNALDAPGFAQARQHVERSIDVYAQTWADGSHDACVATHVQQTQSTQALDLRGACLHDALAGLDATLDVLAHVQGESRMHAHELVDALPSIEACHDVATLRALDEQDALSDDQRTQLHAVRATLKRAKALTIAARYDEAHVALDEVEHDALAFSFVAIEYAMSHADLARVRGDFPSAAEHAEHALDLSMSSQDTRDLDSVLGTLAQVHGFEMGNHARARVYADMLVAHTQQFDGARRASALAAVSVQRVGAGAYLEAIELLREALELREAAVGQDAEYGSMLNDLAVALDYAGKYAESIATYERAVELRRASLGPEHPNVGQSLDNLSQAYLSAGDTDKALLRASQAQTILSATLEPSSVLLAINANTRGNALAGAERWEEAAAALEESERGLLLTLPQSHPNVATVRNGLGIVYEELGRPQKAIAVMRAAQRAHIESLGPEHPSLVINRANFGVTLSRSGHHDEAIEQLRLALALGRKTLGPSHADTIYALTKLSRAHLRAEQWEQADQFAVKALSIYEDVADAPEAELAALQRIRERSSAGLGTRPEQTP